MFHKIISLFLVPMKYLKTILSTLLLTLTVTTINTQIVYTDTEPRASEEELVLLFSKAKDIWIQYDDPDFTVRRLDILETDSGKYLATDGTFDLYEWRDSAWVNLYEMHNIAYNFGSKKFVWDNRIYSFGGYGYWNYHGQLIVFDFDKNEWEILPFTQDLMFGIAYLTEKGLAVSCEKPYTIDLEKKQVFQHVPTNVLSNPIIKSEHEIYKDFRGHLNSLEFENYSYHIGSLTGRILNDKRNQSSMRSTVSPFTTKEPALAFHVFKDELSAFSRKLDLILRTTVQKEMKFFNPINESSRRLHYSSIVIILALFLAAVIWFKTHYGSSAKQSETSKLEQVFYSKEGQMLSMEELDTILKIDHIKSNESKKFRRSQLINEFNKDQAVKQSGFHIERIRDPKDKRRFLYQVEKD